MKHRDEIDGLRAVAVVPIVLFHAGLAPLAGGFVGVDIFFVISGFLITSIISREIEAGQFSLWNFYRRRIVRIFPALFAMLAVTLLVGVLIMLPGELRELGDSAAATSAFLSNMYFRRTTDYFAGSADLKPLLHTWSLGVEEQFYIFYPLLLLLLRGLSRERLRLAILLLTVVSFGMCWIASTRWPNSAFYLLPSRAWELGLGAFIALGGFPDFKAAGRQALAAMGLAAIIVALFVVRADTSFPAPSGLLPVLGTALVIAYGQSTVTGRWLSLPPIRYIGAISYSMYLWHWPIIAFYRIQTGLELSAAETSCLIVACVVAAALSYRWLEQPFLRRFRGGSSRRIVATGAVSLGLGILASVLVTANAANWRTFSPEVLKVISYASYQHSEEQKYQYRESVCFLGEETDQDFDVSKCLSLRDDLQNVVVLGDSHAAQYWRAISLRFPEYNVLQANASGCRPTLKSEGAKRCTDVVNYVLGPLLQTGKLNGIVLAGRWQRDEIEKLKPTIELLRSRGVKVTVIGPTVEYQGEFPALLGRAMMQSDVEALTDLRVEDRKAVDEELSPLVRQWGAEYLSEYDTECPGNQCRTLAPDGSPFHFDYGHMTLSAAQYIVSRLPALVASAGVTEKRAISGANP